MAVFIQKKGRGRPVSWVCWLHCTPPFPSDTPLLLQTRRAMSDRVHGARLCTPCNTILSFKGIFYLWDYCNSSYKRYIFTIITNKVLLYNFYLNLEKLTNFCIVSILRVLVPFLLTCIIPYILISIVWMLAFLWVISCIVG